MNKLIALLIVFISFGALADNERLEIPEVLTYKVTPEPLDIEAAQHLINQVTRLVIDVKCTSEYVQGIRIYENVLMRMLKTMEVKTEADLANKQALLFVNGKLIRAALEAESCSRAAELNRRTIERLKK